MMKLQGSVITEQGLTFAIVVVKPYVLNSPQVRSQTQAAAKRLFPGMPVVLMAQSSKDRLTYYGREDIVNFLKRISLSQIPWREYTVR